MAKTAAKKDRRAGKLQKVLVPVDGSSFSGRAVDYAIDCVKREGPLDLHLISVQVPIDSGHARMFATAEEIDAYHRDEGMTVLKPYLERLDAEGIAYQYHVLVGHVSRTIARFAKEQRFDKVIMGTHGRSGVTHLLLGSVAQNVVRRLKIPVALVK
jgi:nucleotide-binding universal stress UspA family protein